jgi:hypothetical protein
MYPVENTTLQIYCTGILQAKLRAAVTDGTVCNDDGPFGRVLNTMAVFLKFLLADGVDIDDRDGPLGVISAIYP